MKLAVRIGLYLVLLVVAGSFFGRFRSTYSEGVERRRAPDTAAPLPAEPTSVPLNPIPPGDTNVPSLETNSVDGTNATASEPTTEARPEVTNQTAAVPPNRPAAPKKTDAFIHLGVFLLAMLGLGGLGAWDVSRYLGSRAGRSVMADDWIEHKDPEYEKAEEEWAKGNHLEAIGLMRDYLKKNQNEQHVALRIAEIYEKDMGNHLAAALEIEEVLTKKLPREKWGWTAIHLSNLYSGRLNQPDKAMALLERIVQEYSDTGAARKARLRLGMSEPDLTEAVSDSPEPPAEDGSGPNLPKGFRPKK